MRQIQWFPVWSPHSYTYSPLLTAHCILHTFWKRRIWLAQWVQPCEGTLHGATMFTLKNTWCPTGHRLLHCQNRQRHSRPTCHFFRFLVVTRRAWSIPNPYHMKGPDKSDRSATWSFWMKSVRRIWLNISRSYWTQLLCERIRFLAMNVRDIWFNSACQGMALSCWDSSEKVSY